MKTLLLGLALFVSTAALAGPHVPATRATFTQHMVSHATTNPAAFDRLNVREFKGMVALYVNSGGDLGNFSRAWAGSPARLARLNDALLHPLRVIAKPGSFDYTVWETYLDFRTAGEGLTALGAAGETALYFGGNLATAASAGYAIGTGIALGMQTFTPTAWTALSNQVGTIVNGSSVLAPVDPDDEGAIGIEFGTVEAGGMGGGVPGVSITSDKDL